MKLLAIGLILFLCSCTSTISFKGDCTARPAPGVQPTYSDCIITAEDYTVSLTYNEKKDIWQWRMTPNKWYKGAAQSLTGTLHELIPLIGN